MDRYVLLIVVTVVTCCAAKTVYFDIANDPNYPQLISVSNVHYKLAANKYINVSATVAIHEEINDGTNVKLTISPDFPYARLLNNVDVNLCTFCRKELPTYARLIEASSGALPDRCPIKPGVYELQNMRIDIDKWHLLARGFNAAATITLHKNGRILTKLNVKASMKL